jgi:acetyl esterase
VGRLTAPGGPRRSVDCRPVDISGVQALVYQPDDFVGGSLVWAHGGSWTGGSVGGWHDSCTDLARLSGCTLVSVDYRLAPAYPHPAALLDVMTALDWASARGGPVMVGGDSAGATVAACAALTCRDQNVPLAVQVLAYPPLDPLCRASSYGGGYFPSRAGMLAAWNTYRSAADVPSHVYSTPWEVDDLTGVAPTFLTVGDQDPVLDDVRTYAMRLLSAKVTTALRIFPSMKHGEFVRPGSSRLRDWLGQSVRDVVGGSVRLVDQESS